MYNYFFRSIFCISKRLYITTYYITYRIKILLFIMSLLLRNLRLLYNLLHDTLLNLKKKVFFLIHKREFIYILKLIGKK